jgi:hypothetical protein
MNHKKYFFLRRDKDKIWRRGSLETLATVTVVFVSSGHGFRRRSPPTSLPVPPDCRRGEREELHGGWEGRS